MMDWLRHKFGGVGRDEEEEAWGPKGALTNVGRQLLMLVANCYLELPRSSGLWGSSFCCEACVELY